MTPKITTKGSATQGSKDDYYCYCCGSKDHPLKQCPKKGTIDKDDWFANKAKKVMNQMEEDDSIKDPCIWSLMGIRRHPSHI